MLRRSGVAQAGAHEFSLAAAVGGVRGVAESVLPSLVFVVWFTVARDLGPSLVAAGTAAGVLVLARLVARSPVTQAVAGLIGVGVCAFVASRSGQAEDFFLPGFWLNTAYGTVYALSTLRWPAASLPGPPWLRLPAGPLPVIGLLVGPLLGEGLAWRHDPRRLRAYRQVTWLWVLLFAVRLAVQVPLYLAGMVGALGAARIVMGVPLFALTVWVTWLVLRAVPVTRPDAVAGTGEGSGGSAVTG